MKKIFLLMLCMVLVVGTISAWEWDNGKSYDKNTKTVTIKNGCVLGICLGDNIAEIKLDTPLVYEVPRGYQPVAEFTINNFKGYDSVFNKLEFFDVRKDNEKFERDYDYKYKTTIKVPKYKTVCDESLSENGTIEYINCRQKQTGFKNEIVWEEFNINNKLPKGKITIGIFTEVLKGDKVEWIPTLFNFEIDEWAFWKESMEVDLVAYYKFDEQDTTGSGTIIDEIETYNLTNSGADNATGKINTAYDFVTENNDYISGSFTETFTNFSISFWMNWDNVGTDDLEMIIEGQTTNLNILHTGGGAGTNGLRWSLDSSANYFDTANVITSGWNHYVFTYNNIIARLYKNSVLNNSEVISWGDSAMTTLFIGARSGPLYTFDGFLDEIGIWDRVLSSAEVSDLWNDGDGLGYRQIGINITLNSPIDNYNSISPTITFNGSVYDILGNEIVNVSLYINGVINETNSSGINNTDYIFTKILSDGNNNWTYEACDDNDECNSATTRSLTIHKINITSQTYNNETIEGATETFIANVTLRGGESLLSVNLNYNGTSKSASAESLVNGSMWNLISTFTIPGVPADVNISFFWMINLVAGQVNSSSYIQTVRNIGIDNCTTHSNVIFNYTMVDEESQAKLVGNTDNTTLELNIEIFNLDKSVSILNFSTTYNQTNPAAVCLSINLTNETVYVLDSTIKYNADDHVIEYYNIQNFELKDSSIPQEITLYDLLTADSTDFQISFKDEDFIFVENALIFIERQYVSEGVFKTVEIPKTDSNGKTIGHFVRNDIVYNIRVVKEGEILGNFNNIIAFCKDYVIGDCQIVLEAIPSALITFDYDEQLGIIFDSVPVYNNDTNAISFSFVTDDATIKTVSMEVTRRDIFGNRSICNNTLESASGTLLCTIDPNIDDTTLVTSVYVENQLVVLSNVTLESSDYGNLGYVLWFFLTFFFVLFGKSKTEVLIALIISLAGSITLGITRGNIVGIGSAGIWMLVIVVLGIWKINKENPQ